MKRLYFSILTISFFYSCGNTNQVATSDALKPIVTTEPTEFDTDDPAIWINPADPQKSLIVGTDKETDGGL